MSADVQVAQLIATGPQDVWLTGDPQVSFFRSMYRRHAPFGMSLEKMTFASDSVTFDRRGDMLGACYITASDPMTNATLPIFPISAISRVDLFIGCQLIDSQDTTFSSQVWPVTEATTFSQRTAPKSFYPLHFFFCTRPFPLVALQYQDIVIRLLDASPTYKYTLWVNMIHLAEPERAWFKRQTHRILITQVKMSIIDRQRDWSRFSGPIKYLATPCVNYTNIYSPKIIPGGTAQWAKSGEKLAQYGGYVTTDTSGNVLLASDKAILIKYDTLGSLLWTARTSGSGIAKGISVDMSGNSYMAGYFSGTLQIYNSNGNLSSSIVSNGNLNGFIIKYDITGATVWVTKISSTFVSSIEGISSVDINGNSYVTGSYANSTATIYDSTGNPSSTVGPLPFTDANNAFIVKYNTSGIAQWASFVTGSFTQYGYGVSTDNAGNSYITGRYINDPLTIYDSTGNPSSTVGPLPNSGSMEAFVVKYNTSGIAQWATRIGGTGNEIGYGISVDTFGNVYVTGSYTSNPVTIYDSTGNLSSTLPNSGSRDAFVVKYNTSGIAQWATRTGNGTAYGISVDTFGNIYLTGVYASNPMTIYDSTGNLSSTLPNSGSTDAFVVKYNTSGIAQWAKRLSGNLGSNYGYGISADTIGNVYAAGFYRDVLTISDELILTDGARVFLVKYKS